MSLCMACGVKDLPVRQVRIGSGQYDYTTVCMNALECQDRIIKSFPNFKLNSIHQLAEEIFKRISSAGVNESWPHYRPGDSDAK